MEAFAILALAITFLLRYTPFLASHLLFGPFLDNVHIYGPIFSEVSRLASSGDVPYYLPNIGTGFPVFESPHFCILYPFYFLGLINYGGPLNSLYTLTYLTLFHLFIFYVNLYVLLRCGTVPPWAAYIGASVGMLARNTELYASWITITASYAWLPLVLAGGVLLLREIEAQVGIIGRFVAALNDPRDPRYIDHSYEDVLRQRLFQISCGYEDANDCNTLRSDPALKVACDRFPIVGKDLASQPTMSRAENAPRRSELYRMGKALCDTFLASYDRPPKAILLAIDDTEDEVHGAQQQALFNGYYDAYCSLPLHIYEGQSGK